MRKLNEAIDRFCATHPRFGIPGLMRFIVGGNIVIYLLSMFAGYGTLDFLALNPALVLRGEVWRVVTYVFMPTNSGLFLLISCVFYYWLGGALERIWGTAKFNLYYISGVLLTALGAVLVYFVDGIPISIWGASYVNTAMFIAYAMMNPDAMVTLYFIIPIKMKWVAWFEVAVYAVQVLRYAFSGLWGMALLPVIATLNLLVFFAPAMRYRVDWVKAQHRPEAVQFRKAVKEQQRQKGYNHKCCVCGKTDTDYPNIQFRYCSKCQGYHCYCEEHIFNHVHYTE